MAGLGGVRPARLICFYRGSRNQNGEFPLVVRSWRMALGKHVETRGDYF